MKTNKTAKLGKNKFFLAILIITFLLFLGAGIGIGFAIKKETKLKLNNKEVKELKQAIIELEANKEARAAEATRKIARAGEEKRAAIAEAAKKLNQIQTSADQKIRTVEARERGIVMDKKTAEKKNSDLIKTKIELREKLKTAEADKVTAEQQLATKEAELTAVNVQKNKLTETFGQKVDEAVKSFRESLEQNLRDLAKEKATLETELATAKEEIEKLKKSTTDSESS